MNFLDDAVDVQIFRATFSATGSLSIAQISFAPNFASAMARIPEPVPTSSAANFPAPTARGNFEKLQTTARGRVGAGAEGHARLDGDYLATSKLRRGRQPRRRNPENFRRLSAA